MTSKLNISELLFDSLLIILSIVNFYFVKDLFKTVLETSGFVIIIYSLVFLFVPMFLNVYIARLESKFEGTWMAIIKWLVWIYYIVIAMSLMTTSFGHLTQYSTEEEAGYETWGIIFPYVFLIIGPICGVLLKGREKSILKGEKPGSQMAAAVITILVTALILGLIVFAPEYTPYLPFEGAVFNIVLGFILLIIITIIGVKISIAMESFFSSDIVKSVLKISKSFIVPLIIAIIFYFLFQMEMNLLDVMEKVDRECGFGCKVFLMLVTGIIPFRIIMLITPPFKWINLISGILGILALVLLQL